MNIPPVRRRSMPSSVPRHWTLFRAFKILGVPMELSNIHVRRRRDARAHHVPWEERIAGGRAYVYETAHTAYRQAARLRHPDVGGTPDDMVALNRAWAFIQRRYGPRRWHA